MDNKSKYGTSYILKDDKNDRRDSLKQDEDTVPCVSPNDDGESILLLESESVLLEYAFF